MMGCIPARLRLLTAALVVPLILAVSLSTARGGEDVLWPEHVTQLGEARSELDALLAPLMNSPASAEAAQQMRALVDAPAQPLPDRLSLAGAWKVRSLQVNARGAYAYAFTPCTLRREGPSGLLLVKDKGSQRRIGLILDRDGAAFLFVGGRHHADEAPRGYSGFEVEDVNDPNAQADTSHDSVGLVRAIGPGHLIILFAPADDTSEIYELKRS